MLGQLLGLFIPCLLGGLSELDSLTLVPLFHAKIDVARGKIFFKFFKITSDPRHDKSQVFRATRLKCKKEILLKGVCSQPTFHVSKKLREPTYVLSNCLPFSSI